ncbi:MAG: bifunctional tetrahydrofolate synthase/dihydrofolate synthase [Coxiellaceae bacterium]|jgi:dihydrofolate synthase/folylpolyglutamate synthase|nr:bifunctional tetrahydrofolate synthase/dihydrofolate synthase [Coxiellaceae bacterium]
MKINNLTDWLQYLDSLPSGLAHRSLNYLRSLASKLNVLNFAGKVMTVAGTDGKGSTVIFLESILLAAGFKTCAYISPHLLHYNERMRVNGMAVDEKILCWAFNLVQQVCIKADVILSYFEFSTLAALVIFKRQCPDFLILEVGLGGRFDAVNIIDNDISIITTISFDHTKILGDTRDKIGREKAGIIRPFKPVICGKDMPVSVYMVAHNARAILYCLNKDFAYDEKGEFWHWSFGKEILTDLPLPQLPLADAALALMAIKILSVDFKIFQSAIISGLNNAFLPGRFQKLIVYNREMIFDVAHNFEATTLLAANLLKNRLSGRILAVVSMLQDKDISAILKPLVGVIDKWFVGVLNNVRAAKESQLVACFQKNRVKNFTLLPTIARSLQQAIAECGEKDKMIIFGSCYTVAEGFISLKLLEVENGFRI